MLKLLFILLLIGIIFSLLINSVKRKINNMFSGFKPHSSTDKQDKKEEVIYQKDNIVVLKGEANKDKDTKE